MQVVEDSFQIHTSSIDDSSRDSNVATVETKLAMGKRVQGNMEVNGYITLWIGIILLLILRKALLLIFSKAPGQKSKRFKTHKRHNSNTKDDGHICSVNKKPARHANRRHIIPTMVLVNFLLLSRDLDFKSPFSLWTRADTREGSGEKVEVKSGMAGHV